MTGRLAALFAPIVNAAKLAAWPVGSIYMSMQATSPATLFGGTWVAMEGQFLLGATTSSNLYPPLSMGGEAAHALTESEIPPSFACRDTLFYWRTRHEFIRIPDVCQL